MSHENRRTTERYLHSIGEAERRAMHQLENIDLFSGKDFRKKDIPMNMHHEYWYRKVKRPSYEVLRKEVVEMGYVGTGKKYGVSDNAVRKWKKSYELKKNSHTKSHTENAKEKRVAAEAA